MYYGCRLYKWQMDSNPLKTKDGAAVSIANTGSWGAWCRLPTKLNAKDRHVFQSLFTPTRGQTAPSREHKAPQCAQVEASGDPIMLPRWWNLPGVVCSFAAAQQALLLLQILRHLIDWKWERKKRYKRDVEFLPSQNQRNDTWSLQLSLPSSAKEAVFHMHAAVPTAWHRMGDVWSLCLSAGTFAGRRWRLGRAGLHFCCTESACLLPRKKEQERQTFLTFSIREAAQPLI